MTILVTLQQRTKAETRISSPCLSKASFKQATTSLPTYVNSLNFVTI